MVYKYIKFWLGQFWFIFNMFSFLQRICMNNCQYTQTQILPRINKSFQEVGHLSLEKPISEAIKCYVTLDSKLFEAYMEQKTEPIVAIIGKMKSFFA